jgi:uncharacterized protein YodC (DUF2158 family)
MRAGMIVRLKSTGMPLIVMHWNQKGVKCAWRDRRGRYHDGYFDEAELTKL